jgi:hypothetical protein
VSQWCPVGGLKGRIERCRQWPCLRRAAGTAKAAKLRSWRVSILRQRAHYVGTVQAPDERSAEAAAVAEFNLNEEQRKRLAVRALED